MSEHRRVVQATRIWTFSPYHTKPTGFSRWSLSRAGPGRECLFVDCAADAIAGADSAASVLAKA